MKKSYRTIAIQSADPESSLLPKKYFEQYGPARLDKVATLVLNKRDRPICHVEYLEKFDMELQRIGGGSLRYRRRMEDHTGSRVEDTGDIRNKALSDDALLCKSKHKISEPDG